MKEVDGYEGYFADEDGVVYRTQSGNGNIVPVKPYPDRNGYLQVRLKEPAPPWNGNLRKFFVHHVIANVFLPPKPSPKHEVRHLDGNQLNNRSSNLAWGTHKENEADKELHGTKLIGDKVASAKLSTEKVMEIKKRLASGESPEDIAKDFDIGIASITSISAGKYWGHVKVNYKHIRCFTCKKFILNSSSYNGKFCTRECAAMLAVQMTSKYTWCPMCGWQIPDKHNCTAI